MNYKTLVAPLDVLELFLSLYQLNSWCKKGKQADVNYLNRNKPQISLLQSNWYNHVLNTVCSFTAISEMILIMCS